MKEITLEDIEKRMTALTQDDWDEIDVKVQIVKAILNGRKEQGMTQKELGESAGLAQNFIARLENNKTDPQLTTVLRALRPLGKTLAVVPIADGREKPKTADISSTCKTEYVAPSADEAGEAVEYAGMDGALLS